MLLRADGCTTVPPQTLNKLFRALRFLQQSDTCMNGTCTWNACLHLVDVFNRGIALTASLEAELLTCKVVLSAAVAECVAQTRPDKRGALSEQTDGLGTLEFCCLARNCPARNKLPRFF